MSPYARQQGDTISSRHPGSVWIEQNRESLPDNHWVAASANGLVAEGATIGELMSEIDRRNAKPADLAIAFITADAV